MPIALLDCLFITDVEYVICLSKMVGYFRSRRQSVICEQTMRQVGAKKKLGIEC